MLIHTLEGSAKLKKNLGKLFNPTRSIRQRYGGLQRFSERMGKDPR